MDSLTGRADTLSDMVADSLRRGLQAGDYLCGEKLAESVIAREMNVSQNTARDALRILELEGWLARRPRYGLTVYDFNSAEIEELYALRVHLEHLALDWAYPKMTDRDKAGLAGLVSDARMAAAVPQGREFFAFVSQIHERLLTLSGGALLANTLQPLLNRGRLLLNLHTHYASDDDLTEKLTRYGQLITDIRHNLLDRAKITLKEIIMAEYQMISITVDLIRPS
jgi:DNA-binding GntR family transcriptional regulator